jgi:hypothetical protein
MKNWNSSKGAISSSPVRGRRYRLAEENLGMKMITISSFRYRIITCLVMVDKDATTKNMKYIGSGKRRVLQIILRISQINYLYMASTCALYEWL